jgi:heat shock protein HslJ
LWLYILAVGVLIAGCTTGGDQSSLAGTEWVLTSMRGKAPLSGTQVTLVFEEQSLSGFAGCNAYGGASDSGKYTATADGKLTLPLLALTLQLCEGPQGVMQQERIYVESLTSAAAYRMTEDRLEIDNAEGETILVFSRKEEFAMHPGDLVSTRWRLVSMNGEDLLEDSTITLAFHDENQISGLAACRGYVAVYQAAGDDMGIEWMAMTDSACRGPEALQKQEAEYTTMLGWTTDYRLSQGQLEILTARGEALVFEPLPEDADAGLEGTTWAFTAFTEEKTVEGMPAPLPMPTYRLDDSEITLRFEAGTAGGKAVGSAGCNTYQGAYTLDGPTLTLGPLAATRKACESSTMEQEQRYLGCLEDVSGYTIAGRQLRLDTADGRALLFTAKE